MFRRDKNLSSAFQKFIKNNRIPFLIFRIKDFCSLGTLSKRIVLKYMYPNSPNEWRPLIFAAYGSISSKRRNIACFYLATSILALREQFMFSYEGTVEMAYRFFTEALSHDPDDGWSRKGRAEMFENHSLYFPSSYTQNDALRDISEAQDFFRNMNSESSVTKMLKQCEETFKNITEMEEAQ
jgi:hypothetical protein